MPQISEHTTGHNHPLSIHTIDSFQIHRIHPSLCWSSKWLLPKRVTHCNSEYICLNWLKVLYWKYILFNHCLRSSLLSRCLTLCFTLLNKLIICRYSPLYQQMSNVNNLLRRIKLQVYKEFGNITNNWINNLENACKIINKCLLNVSLNSVAPHKTLGYWNIIF